MIEEYYPSTRPVVKTVYQRPVMVLPHTAPVVNHPSVFETTNAHKRGVTLEVYRQRCAMVAKAQSDCKFMVGDTAWPVNEADVEQYGLCQVVGICRHYNDYGTVDWHEPPFILSVQQVGDRTTILNTTANWLVKKKPEFITETMGDC